MNINDKVNVLSRECSEDELLEVYTITGKTYISGKDMYVLDRPVDGVKSIYHSWELNLV